MRVLGLTGGIGSGKTTVAQMFRGLNVPVYIADEEAKKMMDTDTEIIKQIKLLFGEASYKRGNLDRKFLAEQVFNNQELLERLNQIVHPAVGKNFDDWKKHQTSPYVVYEAAILFEKGGYKKCDKNLLITAPREVRIQRVKKRDKATSTEIEARMSHQWPDEKKEELADFVIINEELSETRKEVRKIHEIMLKSA